MNTNINMVSIDSIIEQGNVEQVVCHNCGRRSHYQNMYRIARAITDKRDEETLRMMMEIMELLKWQPAWIAVDVMDIIVLLR